MDCQFLFHWPTKLFTYYEDFFQSHKNELFDEIKTSLENLWQRMIQLSEFFQYSFLLILKRKCLVGASRVRCGESGTPSTIIYTRWSSRRYELWCDAPVGVTSILVSLSISQTDWFVLVVPDHRCNLIPWFIYIYIYWKNFDSLRPSDAYMRSQLCFR